jgi:hypothetical protein
LTKGKGISVFKAKISTKLSKLCVVNNSDTLREYFKLSEIGVSSSIPPKIASSNPFSILKSERVFKEVFKISCTSC